MKRSIGLINRKRCDSTGRSSPKTSCISAREGVTYSQAKGGGGGVAGEVRFVSEHVLLVSGALARGRRQDDGVGRGSRQGGHDLVWT